MSQRQVTLQVREELRKSYTGTVVFLPGGERFKVSEVRGKSASKYNAVQAEALLESRAFEIVDDADAKAPEDPEKTETSSSNESQGDND